MAAKLKFIFLSAVLGILLTAGAVFADSCPYCGNEYGDPMPGDEARVYALRRDHEATCPSRPQELPAGGGFNNAWQIQQQQWAAQQERIRLEQEQARQRRIEDEARKSAEAQRRRLEWQQKKTELMSSLKGASSTDIKLKTGGEVIELKPKGTNFFSLPKEESGMVIKALKVSPKQQEASASAFENLRRSLWLSQKAAKAKDPEEARFLSEQADEAAQGHALRVEVPPAGQTPQISQKELQQFEKLTTAVQHDKLQLDAAAQKRMRLEDERVIMRNKLTALKQEIETQKSQAPPPAPQQTQTPPVSPPPVTETPPVASQTVQEKPEPEKKKGGEDLMAEFLALEKEIQETDEKVDDILKQEGKAKQALGKSQQKLDQFARRS